MISVIIFLLLLFAGIPIFIIIGGITAAGMTGADYPLMLLFQQMFSMAEHKELLAIPLFITASTFMTRGSGAKKLVDFTRQLVGWLPGGMAMATIGSCLIFAALSGMSPTAIIAVGALMLPGLTKGGYSEKFSLGLVTSSGSLGILVPPSIVVLIFGVVGEVNIEALFIAGVIPIFLIASIFTAYSIYTGKKDGVKNPPADGAAIRASFFSAIWALLMPIIICAGIFSGKMTVTQAGAIAAVYALLCETVIYRSFKLSALPSIMREAGAMTGMLMIIISVTFGFNWFLTVQGIPAMLTDWIIAHFHSSFTFLVAVNILLLFLGCLMDILSAVFITVPLLLPAAIAMGIDPVHFGIIFIVNFEIGYLTPPVGINLFTSSAVFRKPVDEVARSVAPFLALMLAALIAITYYPPLSLWLVHLTGNM